MVLPLVHVGSSRSGHTRSIYNVGKSSSDDSELIPNEADPYEVGMPHGLISPFQLRKIIARYHIHLILFIKFLTLMSTSPFLVLLR